MQAGGRRPFVHIVQNYYVQVGIIMQTLLCNGTLCKIMICSLDLILPNCDVFVTIIITITNFIIDMISLVLSLLFSFI